MSLRQTLGLSTFPITDAEIMHRIDEARKKKQEFVEFALGKKVIRVRLPSLSPEGLMRDYDDYYGAQ